MKIENLIEKAIKKTGSQQLLGKLLGVGSNRVGDWAKGRVPCQPADQARIADLAGEDATKVLIDATIEQHEGTPRGDQLKAALKKRIAQAGGESGTTAATVLGLWAGISWLAGWLDIPRCIKSKVCINPNTGFTGDGLTNLG